EDAAPAAEANPSPVRFPFDNTYARLPARFYARLDPVPVAAPRLVRVHAELAESLGLDRAALASREGVAALAGTSVAEGGEPVAMLGAGTAMARCALSYMRLGTSQSVAAGRDTAAAGPLAACGIERHSADVSAADRPYGALHDIVVISNADLVAHCVLIGLNL